MTSTRNNIVILRAVGVYVTATVSDSARFRFTNFSVATISNVAGTCSSSDAGVEINNTGTGGVP